MKFEDNLNVKRTKPSDEEIKEWLKRSKKYEHLLKEYSRKFIEEFENAKKKMLKENMNKLYVLEWDGWSFEGVFKTRAKAKSCVRSNMEAVREVKVSGDILNNEIFIIMDSRGDYGGIHSNLQDAQLELDGYYEKEKFEVIAVKIL